ncbi:response regulator [Paenibacillus sepulcri]
MVVEDEPEILQSLMRMIASQIEIVSSVIGAEDSFEALDKMRSVSPDLLVTDIHMPEMTGLELIDKAKRLGKCGRFAILTGYSDFAYARQAIRLSVEDYLLKPVNREELFRLLRNVYDHLHPAREMKSKPQSGLRPDEMPVSAGEEMPAGRAVQKALAYINQHYTEDLALEQVAEAASVHPNYLVHLLKKERGVTFLHYLQRIRVDMAVQLLTCGEMLTVAEIGRMVGFENTRNFFKVFKRHEGVAPGQYRMQHALPPEHL